MWWRRHTFLVKNREEERGCSLDRLNVIQSWSRDYQHLSTRPLSTYRWAQKRGACFGAKFGQWDSCPPPQTVSTQIVMSATGATSATNAVLKRKKTPFWNVEFPLGWVKSNVGDNLDLKQNKRKTLTVHYFQQTETKYANALWKIQTPNIWRDLRSFWWDYRQYNRYFKWRAKNEHTVVTLLFCVASTAARYIHAAPDHSSRSSTLTDNFKCIWHTNFLDWVQGHKYGICGLCQIMTIVVTRYRVATDLLNRKQAVKGTDTNWCQTITTKHPNCGSDPGTKRQTICTLFW